MMQTSEDSSVVRGPLAEAAGGRERRRVTSSRRVVVGDLTAAERAELSERTYAVYTTFKKGVDRAAFEREVFADPRATLALFHGEDGAFAGFTHAAVMRVEHEGQRHAVFIGSIFIDTRYKGAGAAALFCFGEVLRFKLREPRTPLACIGVMTTPASYRRLAMTLSTMYPRTGDATPARALGLMLETARQRGLAVIDEAKGLVTSRGAMRHPERLRAARTLRDDPHAAFYLERNPHFDEGVGMLVWVPLDAANVLYSLGRYLVRGRRA